MVLKIFSLLSLLLDRADTKQASVVLEMIELDPCVSAWETACGFLFLSAKAHGALDLGQPILPLTEARGRVGVPYPRLGV